MSKKFNGIFSKQDLAAINTGSQNVLSVMDKPPCVEVMVVGGGGGGGQTQTTYSGGGGGGGGIRHANRVYIAPGFQYTVTVGAGGNIQRNGAHSQFGPIVCLGGGGGGENDSSGYNGGSGGGAGGNYTNASASWGGGSTTPEYAYRHMFASQHRNPDPYYHGQSKKANNRGGGGGSCAKGDIGRYPGAAYGVDMNWHAYTTYGRIGLTSSITGSYQSYGGGGGAGATPGGSGDVVGGMGAAGGAINSGATAAEANNGKGGGGSGTNSSNTGCQGGSGIVIIRYPAVYNDPISVTGTYNTSNTSIANGYKVYTFLSSGTITF
jgi:hypothetical protein